METERKQQVLDFLKFMRNNTFMAVWGEAAIHVFLGRECPIYMSMVYPFLLSLLAAGLKLTIKYWDSKWLLSNITVIISMSLMVIMTENSITLSPNAFVLSPMLVLYLQLRL